MPRLANSPRTRSAVSLTSVVRNMSIREFGTACSTRHHRSITGGVNFERLCSDPNVKAILVNIFGGIMKCDTIAEGVIAASKAVGLKVPLVVRMKGTNEELGREILAKSGLPIISANNMAEAAEKVVAAANGR